MLKTVVFLDGLLLIAEHIKYTRSREDYQYSFTLSSLLFLKTLPQQYGSVKANAGSCLCRYYLHCVNRFVEVLYMKADAEKIIPLVKMLRVLRTVLSIRLLEVSLQREHPDLVKLQR